MAAFRFEEELMRRFIRELYNLVLDRWTIPRSRASDLTGIKGGSTEVFSNDVMGSLGRMSYPAGDLFHVELSSTNAVEGKNLRLTVANLIQIE
jgi:hypothetical protein